MEEEEEERRKRIRIMRKSRMKKKKRRKMRRKRRKKTRKRRRMKSSRRHRKGKIFLSKIFTPRTFLLTFVVCHISACTSISIENQRNSDCQIHPSSCTVRTELIITQKHISHNTCNFYMIAALCKLNKDDFDSNIIINRLINLLYIEIHMNTHVVYIFFVKLYFSRLIFLGPHIIVISYNPEPTIPGASYDHCHTCLLLL